MTLKLHRIVSRTGPASEARCDAQALTRAENEGWPSVKRDRSKTRKAVVPQRAH